MSTIRKIIWLIVITSCSALSQVPIISVSSLPCSQLFSSFFPTIDQLSSFPFSLIFSFHFLIQVWSNNCLILIICAGHFTFFCTEVVFLIDKPLLITHLISPFHSLCSLPHSYFKRSLISLSISIFIINRVDYFCSRVVV